MPTERFYRLSEEKQKVIYEAARKEFARVPYEKASINQIIKNADISRGSFYTYFEDKRDAMEYVMKENFDQIQKICEEALAKNNGEYLGMLQELFDFLVEQMNHTTEIMAVMNHVLVSQENQVFEEKKPYMVNLVVGKERDISAEWILEKANWGMMRSQNSEENSSLIMMGAHILHSALEMYYMHPTKLELIRSLLKAKLDILRYGAYKQPAMQL